MPYSDIWKFEIDKIDYLLSKINLSIERKNKKIDSYLEIVKNKYFSGKGLIGNEKRYMKKYKRLEDMCTEHKAELGER